MKYSGYIGAGEGWRTGKRDSGRVKETCRIKNNLYNLKGSFRRGKSLKDPFIQPWIGERFS